MCFEFPFYIGAPMNRVWCDAEWESLSEPDKQARIEASRGKIQSNFSEWAVKGDDGIWRRKGSGEKVKDAATELSIIESAKGGYNWYKLDGSRQQVAV
jgi:hypothetical protein